MRLEFVDKSIYGGPENEHEGEPTLVVLWNFLLSCYKEQLKDLLCAVEG